MAHFNFLIGMFGKCTIGHPLSNQTYFTSNRPVNKKVHFQLILRIWLLILIVFGVCTLLLFTTSSLRIKIKNIRFEDYLIYQVGCKIPRLMINDTLISMNFYKESEIKCNEYKPALFTSNMTSIYIIESSLSYYSMASLDSAQCCYQIFHRKVNKGSMNNKFYYEKTCRNFTKSARINDPFIRVTCTNGTSEIYTDFFSFVPITNLKNGPHLNNDRLNVLIIGIDSVSRLTFHSQMPLTAEYLEDLNAVEMLGYHKVGYPNLLAVLTGLSWYEFRTTCWINASNIDNCSFIWNLYKEQGYVTAFGADMPSRDLFGAYSKGFLKQPTDYYLDHFEYTLSLNKTDTLCIRGRHIDRILLKYVSTFTHTMHRLGKKYFGFFWMSTLTSNKVKTPQTCDKHYANFLSELNEAGILNSTVLIFMSDHGNKNGAVSTSYQNMLEHRLPYLFVRFPVWFVQKYDVLIKNLGYNSGRLTTNFDLHETLKNLLYPNNLTNNNLLKRASSFESRGRSMSLFDEIGSDRACSDAGIERAWCACHDVRTIDEKNWRVSEVIDFAIHFINDKIHEFPYCVDLELDQVFSAWIEPISKNIDDFNVRFRTKPGGAIFTSTIRKQVGANGFQFDVMKMNRLNPNENESKCIDVIRLRPYCYCKDYV